MKLKPSVVAGDDNPRRQHFPEPVPAIGLGRLDNVFHGLLLAVGIALSVAAAAQAALDSPSAGFAREQIAASHRAEVGRIAERAASQSTPSVRALQRPQQNRS